jgi:hypothetical protein
MDFGARGELPRVFFCLVRKRSKTPIRRLAFPGLSAPFYFAKKIFRRPELPIPIVEI